VRRDESDRALFRKGAGIEWIQQSAGASNQREKQGILIPSPPIPSGKRASSHRVIENRKEPHAGVGSREVIGPWRLSFLRCPPIGGWSSLLERGNRLNCWSTDWSSRGNMQRPSRTGPTHRRTRRRLHDKALRPTAGARLERGDREGRDLILSGSFSTIYDN